MEPIFISVTSLQDWLLKEMKEIKITLHKRMKFSIKDLFSKCDQIRRKLRIWSHLLKKSLVENVIFCAELFEHIYRIICNVFNTVSLALLQREFNLFFKLGKACSSLSSFTIFLYCKL